MIGAFIAIGWIALKLSIKQLRKEANSDSAALVGGCLMVLSFGCIGWAAEMALRAIVRAVL